MTFKEWENANSYSEEFKAFRTLTLEQVWDASRTQAIKDAVEAVDSAGGDNEDYHIEAIQRKFGIAR